MSTTTARKPSPAGTSLFTRAGCAYLAVLAAVATVLALLFSRIPPDDETKASRAIRKVGGMTDAGAPDGETTFPIRMVYFRGPKFTDAEMEQVAPDLANLRELYTLDLSMAHVTDEGLGHLRGLNRLAELTLRYTWITDAGINHLKDWHQLVGLDLMQTRISDRGLEQIVREHPNLKSLDLDRTLVTDRGLAHLKELRQLEWLALADTAATDEALSAVGDLTNLQTLSLCGTRVTGAGLGRLKGLKLLRTLYLERTNLNDRDLAPLQASVPGLQIKR
jgi:Leucine-rich repeat (LRR) protein